MQETRSEGSRDFGDGSSLTESGSVQSAPVYKTGSEESELDRFEASLHMPVDRANSAREVSRSRDPSDTGSIKSREGSRHPSASSGHGKTVTLLVPPTHGGRTSGDSGGSIRSYSREPITAHRIQPEGASQNEADDLDFSPRHRCHSDSKYGPERGYLGQRPLSSCQHDDAQLVTGLPPKGIPKSYSQRLEHNPSPMDGFTSNYPYPMDTSGDTFRRDNPHSVIPPQNQAPVDSLRNVMIRRWDSEHSCLPSNQVHHGYPGHVTGDHMTRSYPPPLSANQQAPAGNTVHLACWVSSEAVPWDLNTQTCI